MTNTNCLEGVKCPACGNEDTFRIEVTTLATVTDDGTDFESGHVGWDENSYTECANCLKHGKLSGFTVPRPVPSSPPIPLLLDVLDHLCTTLKLRHLDEASDLEVEEALRLASTTLAFAKGGAAHA